MRKKKTKIPKILKSSLLMMAGLIISFFVLSSCNGNEKDKKEQSTKDTSNQQQAKKDAPLMANGYAVVRLSNADLQALFTNPAGPGGPPRKLIIEFRDDNIANAPMMGVAFGCRQNGNTATGPINLNQAGTQVLPNNGSEILGNNELRKNQITTLIGGPISSYTGDLYFYPKKDTDNHIRYVVWTSLIPFLNAEAFAYPPGPETNPSPPAPPCTVCE